MNAWLAIVLVGAGSYGMRFVPLLLADRWAPGPRMDRALRQAGTAALTALAVAGLRAEPLTATGGDTAVTGAAVLVGSVAALRGHSLTVVVGAGVAVHAALSILS